MTSKRNGILLLILLALLALMGLPADLARTGGVSLDIKKSAVRRWVPNVFSVPSTLTPVPSTASPQAMGTSTPIQSGNVPPAPSPTTEWTYNPPGEVIAPILIYHHIADKTPANRYFVSPKVFETQIRYLQRWGYTSIPLSLLVKALTAGAELPPRPVVITFDDGYRDVYTYAFPILRRYGFSGVVYIIAGGIGVGKYMNAGELRELAAAGWEIGSHSWTHAKLRNTSPKLDREIVESRQRLEELLDQPVETFNFPYGLTSKYITGLVQDAGYVAAVGLGPSFRHTLKTRYYLSRIEVRSNYDFEQFSKLLPWAGDVETEDQTPTKEVRGVEGE